MTALEDPLLFAPPARLRRPAFWTALVAFSLLLGGLYTIALPDTMSGPIWWTFDAEHGLHQADMRGLMLLALGIGMTWVTGLIWRWQQSH